MLCNGVHVLGYLTYQSKNLDISARLTQFPSTLGCISLLPTRIFNHSFNACICLVNIRTVRYTEMDLSFQKLRICKQNQPYTQMSVRQYGYDKFNRHDGKFIL